MLILERLRLFPPKKGILTLLKRTGVPLELVNLFNCNAWHDVFGKSFDLWVRVMSPNEKEMNHGRVSVAFSMKLFCDGPISFID